ncbi:MAG: helix-turn-helix domain-containing protein [Polyangiales bacterium]
MTTDESAWRSDDDTAAHLGVDVATVRAWVRDRGMPGYRIGKQLKFKLAEVDRWVRDGNAADDEGAHDASAAIERLCIEASTLIDSDDAQAALTLLRSERAPSTPTFELSTIEARALTVLGRYVEALSTLDQRLPNQQQRAEWMILRARLLIEMGRHREATEIAREIALTNATDDQSALSHAANTLAYLGLLREALPLVERLQHSQDVRTRARVFTLLVDGGEIGRADAILAARAPSEVDDPRWTLCIRQLALPRALFEGEIQHAEAALRVAIATCPPAEVQALAVDAVTLSTVRGRRAAVLGLRDDVPEVVGYQAETLAYERARNAARHGVLIDTEGLPSVAHDGPAWLRVRAALLEAEQALVSGKLDRARVFAEQATAIARSGGAPTLLAESLNVLAEVKIVAREDPCECTIALAQIGRDAPSARCTLDAEAIERLTAASPDWFALHRVALAHDRSPVYARRAQALLGGRPLLDRVDLAVLEALRARPAFARMAIVVSPAELYGAGWWFDEAAMALGFSSGRTLELGRRRLQAELVHVIAERGAASKEELVRRVWGRHDYHPLRDDKRLQVAIRALRIDIEDDPTTPRRIVTTESGYAIGHTERFFRA